MFDLNSKTLVDREFKTKEILKMINADKDIKKDASSIEKIILTNVISGKACFPRSAMLQR